MSATRDKSQKFTFVYSNLYQIYKNGQAAPGGPVPPPAPAGAALPGLTTGKILKADDVAGGKQPFGTVQVKSFQPAELIGKRIEAGVRVEKSATALPAIQAVPTPPPFVHPSQNEAIASLRDNLKTLSDLHERLKFMLQELEDLVKE